MKSSLKIIRKDVATSGRATIVTLKVLDNLTGEVVDFSGCAIRDPQDVPNANIGIDIAEERALIKAYKFFRNQIKQSLNWAEKSYRRIEKEYLTLNTFLANSQSRLANMLDVEEDE